MPWHLLVLQHRDLYAVKTCSIRLPVWFRLSVTRKLRFESRACLTDSNYLDLVSKNKFELYLGEVYNTGPWVSTRPRLTSGQRAKNSSSGFFTSLKKRQ